MGVMATVISNHKVATILDILRHVHKDLNQEVPLLYIKYVGF